MKRTFALLALVAAILLPATLASADPSADPLPTAEEVVKGGDFVEAVDDVGETPSDRWLVWGCYEGYRFYGAIGPLGWYGIVIPEGVCHFTNFIRYY